MINWFCTSTADCSFLVQLPWLHLICWIIPELYTSPVKEKSVGFESCFNSLKKKFWLILFLMHPIIIRECIPVHTCISEDFHLSERTFSHHKLTIIRRRGCKISSELLLLRWLLFLAPFWVNSKDRCGENPTRSAVNSHATVKVTVITL